MDGRFKFYFYTSLHAPRLLFIIDEVFFITNILVYEIESKQAISSNIIIV